MPILDALAKDGTDFIQGKVTDIDIPNATVSYTPNERMGDMGRHKAFYMHTDTWYGGKTSVLKMGYRYYEMKLAFKRMYYETGGKTPEWGIPLTQFLAETL